MTTQQTKVVKSCRKGTVQREVARGPYAYSLAPVSAFLAPYFAIHPVAHPTHTNDRGES